MNSHPFVRSCENRAAPAQKDGAPGDVVEVKVLRDGQPITAKVTLEQRK
jgi:S1-C subfamily serine protease